MFICNFSSDTTVAILVEGVVLLTLTTAMVFYIVAIHFQEKYATLYSDGWVYANNEINRVAGESKSRTTQE